MLPLLQKTRPSFIQQPIVKSILGHYVPEEEEEFVQRKHDKNLKYLCTNCYIIVG